MSVEEKYKINDEDQHNGINPAMSPISPGAFSYTTVNGTGVTREHQTLLASTSEERCYQNYNEDQQNRNKNVPFKGICLAVVLLIFGVTFVSFGALLIADLIEFQSLDGITPYGLVVFGLVCIIPGAYHVRHAICACCGLRGYSWDDIPNC